MISRNHTSVRRVLYAGLAGVLVVACTERPSGDDIPAVGVDIPAVGDNVPAVDAAVDTCDWRGDEALVFSDLRVVESSGDHTGLEIAFKQDDSEWAGSWRYGEGPISRWYNVDSLELDEKAGRIAFVLPPVQGNLAMRFEGGIWCDSLVANQTFGRVSRVRRLPRTREP